MKETVNVNIGSMAFTLDEDAYHALKHYFDEVRRHLPEGDTETLADIEARIAEIFREQVQSPMRVISLSHVRTAMAQMGAPAEFGEAREAADEAPAEEPHRLYRSRTNRSIAGVCGGLGDFFGIDPTLLRLVTLALILLGGLSLWVYILLWVIIPEKPLEFRLHRNKTNK